MIAVLVVQSAAPSEAIHLVDEDRVGVFINALYESKPGQIMRVAVFHPIDERESD